MRDLSPKQADALEKQVKWPAQESTKEYIPTPEGKVTKARMERLSNRFATDPDSLSDDQKKMVTAYNMKTRSGGLDANPASYTAHHAGKPEHARAT